MIGQVLGGGRYGAYGQGNDRVAVDQCARAVEARVSQDNRRGVYGRWNQGYGNQGYGNQAYGNQGYGNQGYNQAYGTAQVVGITNVQRVRNGLKVSGLIDTRMGANLGGYGQYNQYGQAIPAIRTTRAMASQAMATRPITPPMPTCVSAAASIIAAASPTSTSAATAAAKPTAP